MIYEYAFDPEALIELSDTQLGRARIIEAFKQGAPYIRSEYPKNLPRKTMELFDKKYPKKDDSKTQSKKYKLGVLLNSFHYATAKRKGCTESGNDFSGEYKRLKFYKIITDNKAYPGGHITKEMLKDELNNPFKLDSQRGRRVKRHSNEMTECLAPLLKLATKFQFIDPFFFPSTQFRRTYSKFFSTISSVNNIRVKNGCRQIDIICSYKKVIGETSLKDFSKQCKEELPKWICGSTKLFIYPIMELRKGQELHNRYILTEVGGVILGHGTDCSKDESSSTYDDINLLSAEQYEELKKLYEPSSVYFDWPDPIVISTDNT